MYMYMYIYSYIACTCIYTCVYHVINIYIYMYACIHILVVYTCIFWICCARTLTSVGRHMYIYIILYIYIYTSRLLGSIQNIEGVKENMYIICSALIYVHIYIHVLCVHMYLYSM